MPVRTEVLMGTLVTIDLVPRDDTNAAAAIERAFGWFRAIEATCTRFDDHSELMRLNARPGTPVPVSDTLFEAIRFAVAVAGDTGGAFDPTVGARMAARGFNREHRTGRRVSANAAGENATYRDVVVDEDRRTVTLRRPLTLDLGAIAKGLAVDASARELEACGSFSGFAIDAGGDLFLSGHNHHAAPWTVGIRHPRRDGELIETLQISGRAVCTSADDERPDHLIDPRTGASATAAASVTVIAPNAMLADALATAAFVLGPQDGVRLLERHGVAGVIYAPDLRRHATTGFPGA